jgi:small subunit ribosomal protein S2
MKNVTLEELLEAGCHFGHQVTRQNPKARDSIFEARDGIHIIDLEKTKEGLEEAATFVRALAQKGGNLLVLGTKKQAQSILQEEMKRATDAGTEGLFLVTQRWIGGTLTNFPEVSKNYKRLKDLTARLQDDVAKQGYTKKEIGDWDKTRAKLHGFYGGTADMSKTPEALFIVDTHNEQVAVAEAMKMGVKTVGITDTNSDPTIIDYPIPANDDAVGSLKLIINYIFDAWIEGRKHMGEEVKASEDKETKKTEKKEPAAKEEKNTSASSAQKAEANAPKETKTVKKAPKKAAKATEKKEEVVK